MSSEKNNVRVLYSFPLKLGAGRVCTTAWQQAEGVAAAGADVTVFTACISKPLPPTVKVHTTLARGKFRIPNRLLGRSAYGALHDWMVARQVRKLEGKIDIVHAWPLGSLRTLKAAASLGIPTVLERCNAHTRYAYRAVEEECQRLGITMPENHEHAFNAGYLRKEEEEYRAADHLLCPSDFVARTFRDERFPAQKLLRHQYGFDEKVFQPGQQNAANTPGLTLLFAGGCAPRKGLHYALEAWLKSGAHEKGTFLIAGGFIPGYAEKLGQMLSHPSVKVLGHRHDVPDLMRRSDLFVLPSIEEGSALVTMEARGSGCVILVSEASGAICRHMENALVHKVRDVATLTEQMKMLDKDRNLWQRLRTQSLATASTITWKAAGVRLLEVYREAITVKRQSSRN